MKGGYFELGRIRGIPIRLHWSAFLVPLVLSGGRFVLEGFLGFVLIVLVHELGHAAVARRRRLRVLEVAIHGLGGHCRHVAGSELDGQVIAWGGVLAQGWLALAASVVRLVLHARRDVLPIESAVAYETSLDLLVEWNLHIAMFNLLPIPGFDGQAAWRLPGTLYRGILAPMTASTAVREAKPTRAERTSAEDGDALPADQRAAVDALVAGAFAQARSRRASEDEPR